MTIRAGDGDRRGSAGPIIIVAARLVGDGPFRGTVCTDVCQGNAHLKFSFEGVFQEYVGRFLKFTTKSDVVANVLISSALYFIINDSLTEAAPNIQRRFEEAYCVVPGSSICSCAPAFEA